MIPWGPWLNIQPWDQEILAPVREPERFRSQKQALHGLLGNKKHTTVSCLNWDGSVEQKPHYPNTSTGTSF